MCDLTDSAWKLREFVYCLRCQKPVDAVRSETESVLLRRRFVIECHGRLAFICERDPEFGAALAGMRGHWPPRRLEVFKDGRSGTALPSSGGPPCTLPGGIGNGSRSSLTLVGGGEARG